MPDVDARSFDAGGGYDDFGFDGGGGGGAGAAGAIDGGAGMDFSSTFGTTYGASGWFAGGGGGLALWRRARELEQREGW